MRIPRRQLPEPPPEPSQLWGWILVLGLLLLLGVPILDLIWNLW